MRSHRKTISEKHYSYLPKTSNNSNVNQLMNGKTNAVYLCSGILFSNEKESGASTLQHR